jgi:hypothetical protein
LSLNGPSNRPFGRPGLGLLRPAEHASAAAQRRGVRLLEGGVVRRLCSLWLGLILVSQPTYAQAPAAVSTADRHHPFVEHVEGRYTKYLAAENQGDTAAYREVRSRWAYETTLEQLKKLGKAESELGSMLKRVASLRSDISQFTFVRCDARTRVARLLYRREGVGPKGPTLEFAAFMTHWEDGAWRIGWVGRASGPATRSNGEKFTADELVGDPRFALD